MNILFRKNLSGEGGGGGGGGKRGTGGGRSAGARKKGAKVGRPASSLEEHYGLRTHIFLAPPPLGQRRAEERCTGDHISTGIADDNLHYQVQWRRTPRASDFGPAEVDTTVGPAEVEPATAGPTLFSTSTSLQIVRTGVNLIDSLLQHHRAGDERRALRWSLRGGLLASIPFYAVSVSRPPLRLHRRALRSSPALKKVYNVSFSEMGFGGRSRQPISLLPVPRAELAQLRALDKDCFIIPVASLDRFLPAGVPMPLLEKEEQRGLSVLEVDDPKICLLIHLMTQMEPIEPILESPLSLPHVQQARAAAELLLEMRGSAAEGMLLSNIEKNAEFPFISYYVINKSKTDPREFFHNCRAASLRKFDPRTLRYSAVHTFDLFNEVATIARPPLEPNSKRPASPATGFIVSLYKVFEGDDGEKFEKNWLYWTGARMIYRSLPKSVGLRRLTLHKSVSSGDKLYFLLVECSNLLEELGAAAALIPPLRARLCGYTGLYRAATLF